MISLGNALRIALKVPHFFSKIGCFMLRMENESSVGQNLIQD